MSGEETAAVGGREEAHGMRTGLRARRWLANGEWSGHLPMAWGSRTGDSGGRPRWVGAAVAGFGGYLAIKALPLWIWPMGVGLWMVWLGLGPLVLAAVVVWIGLRLLGAARG